MSFSRYVLQRLMLAVVTLFGVLVAVFVLTHLLPGNPALVKVGQYADPKVVKAMEHQMGLDKPLPLQFLDYLGRVAHGNLGESWTTGQPVNKDLWQRIPATVELALFSLLIGVVVGLPLGIVAAVKRRSWLDKLTQAVTISGASAPLFWLGLMLIYLVFYKWHLVPPPTGRLDDFMAEPRRITGLFTIDALLTGQPAIFRSALMHLLLPGLSLAFVIIAPIAKMTRSAMIQVLRTDFIQTARAIGLSPSRYVLRDALRNALIPVLTTLGVVLGYLMAGSVLIEKIFAWPGIGIYAWNALQANDFEAIQGFVLTVAVSYVCINLIVDLLYSAVDPRIRLT